MLVGGDDWALEGFCAGATGWVTGVADVAPGECVALYDACRTGELPAAREIYARLLPLARFDMTPKLVQYFKAAHGRGRPRRRSVPPAADAAHRRRAGGAGRRARGPAQRRRGVRAARYLAAVDSHTEGMPTRVVTGGVGPIPGATMLERKLHFEAELDDLRLLLMREPRGHSAMSGAILQPPTRDDADWGVLFIEVSGCLPMCGHGTIGVATVLVETGMVEVREPETVVRLDTPAGLIEARVAVSGGRATGVTLRNVPSFLHERDREVAGVRYDIAYGGNFYALVAAAEAGVTVDPARADRADRARGGDHGRDRRRGAAGAPGRPADLRLPPRGLPRARPRRRRRGQRDLDPPGLARPLAVRDRHLGADGAALGRRRAGDRRARSSTSP